MVEMIKQVLQERGQLPDLHLDDYAHVSSLPKGPFAETVLREVLVTIATNRGYVAQVSLG